MRKNASRDITELIFKTYNVKRTIIQIPPYILKLISIQVVALNWPSMQGFSEMLPKKIQTHKEFKEQLLCTTYYYIETSIHAEVYNRSGNEFGRLAIDSQR